MNSMITKITRCFALICALGLAGGAWAVAPTPTVVWESDFDTTTKTDTDGNSYTLNANGNSVAANASSITINQSVGVKVDASAALTSGMTVLVRYSDLNLSLGSAQTLVNSSIDSDGTATGDGNGNRTGVYIDSSGASQGLWGGNTCISANGVSQTSHTFVATETSGVMAFSYYSASTTDSNLGTHLWYLSNGTRSALYNLKTLGSTSDSSIYGCVIGGPRGSTTNGGPATGMKITGIAIFKGVLSESQMTSFIWPSAAAAEYAKWSYASYVLTCNSGFSNFESPNYSTFDLKSGYDIKPTYTTAVAPVKWQCFGYSKASNFDSTAYAAPGNVIRFVNESHACVAKFSPLTIGGMIVESTATGCSFDKSDGTRLTILGDPTASAETWFKFDSSFSMAREGAYAIMGTVNLEINNSASVTFSGAAQISGASEKAAGTNPSHTAGGVLKLHGNGSMTVSSIDASDATIDYTDLSATCSSSTDAYIQGTVTVNGDTVIALPAGATFPYFIAKGISGGTDFETGVTIGGVAAPNYVSKSDGSIVYSVPAEATISSNATWGSGELEGWTTDDATKIYTINVTSDAVLTLGSAVSLNRLTLNVSKGATLTISGAYTITAADCIYVTGAGKVATAAAATFSATMKGDGTLCYDMNNGTTKPSGIDCTSDDWAGMLWIKNGAYTGWNFNTASGAYIKYGSANSTLRIENVTCYLNATETVGFTLDLHGEGLKITNGNEHKVETVKKLTGSGTLAISGGAANGNGFIIQDGSEFAGSINITTGNYVVNFADSGTYASSTTGGKIIIGSGETATVASGKTWSTNNKNGIEINGTLTLADSTSTLTGTISGSGTVVGNQCFPVPGSSFKGTLSVTGAVRPNSPLETTATAVYGSVLNVSGSVYLTGNVTTLPDTINIASGAYLMFGNADMTSLTLKPGTWEGVLYIGDACTSLATLTVNAGTERELSSAKFAPDSSTTLATVNIFLDEVAGEGGTITLTSVTGLTAVEGRTYNFTVNCLDGRTVSGTYDGSKSTVAYAPSVSGSATLYDVTFTNTYAFAYTSKSNAMVLDSNVAQPFYNNNLNNETTGLYIRHHPYTSDNNTDLYSLENFSAVVVGQMSPTPNTIFIHMGSSQSTDPGLLIATTANKDEVVIAPNSGSTVDVDNAVKVKVPNAATARHAYVITRSGTTFTVWVDGICRGNFTVASDFKLGVSGHSGIQVGSDFGGGIKDAAVYTAVDNSTNETGVVNCIRIFDHVLTEAERNQITAVYPYESKAGLYTRTVSADADLSATDAWAKDGEAYALPESATVDGVDYDPSVTVTASAAAKLTANADLAVDTLTVEGTGTLTFDSDGTHAVSVTGAAVFNSPVVVKYGALNLSGTPVGLGSGGTLTFDCSGIDAASIYTTKHFQLTGVVKRDDAKIAATLPSAAYRTVELAYNANGYYELVVTPNHENGAAVYFKSGYLASNMNGTDSGTVYVDSAFTTQTVMFPGDTMVINNNSALDSGTKVWIKADFVGNIRISRTSAMSLINGGNASGAILDGVTITVDSGSTLNISKNDVAALNIGAATINGDGTVNIPSATTVSGAVTGTAALTISGAVNVASGGSIANTVVGDGTVDFSNCSSLPDALTFSSWTGTVVLPQLDSIDGDTFSFNSYGIEGSTVRVSGIGGGLLKDEEVNPTIDIPEGVTFTISDFFPSFNNTFKALSGAGTFAVTYDTAIDTTSDSWQSNYSAYFLVKNVSNFTGSLSTATPGIAIGSDKPAYNTPGGKIYLNLDGATLADSTTPVPETTLEGYYVKHVDGVYSLKKYTGFMLLAY